MGFFDDITKKLSMVGQEAATQTKSFAEKTRLNSRLSDEEKQLNALFQVLGKNYFEANKDNPNADFADQITAIKDGYVRIEGIKEQLRTVAGIRICPNCSAEVTLGSMFCNSCGAKMPAEAPAAQVAPGGNVCPQCGNTVAYGAAFCNICGGKMPEVQRQPLGGVMNPENGAFSTPGFDTSMNQIPASPIYNAPVVPATPAAPVIPDMNTPHTAVPVPNNVSAPVIPVIDNPDVPAPKKTVSIEKKD